MIRWLIQPIYQYIKLAVFRNEWRLHNKNNYTVPGNFFDMKSVTVGKETYGTLNVNSFGNPNEKLDIGCYCSIAGDVKFILGGEHDYKKVSTYPVGAFKNNKNYIVRTKGKIVISDDVWIGYGAIILSGVNIGKGAVIAAGTIVSSDIPPYAVYSNHGIIKYRFSESIINKLLAIDYSFLDIKGYIDLSINDAVDAIQKREESEYAEAKKT